MTTTELIKILKDNEYGGISHKPRELSLTIKGKYMPNPQITLSSTGDGICGAEIDLDVDGEFFVEQEPKTEWIPVSYRMPEKRGMYIVTEKVFSPDDRDRTGRFNRMTEQVEFFNGKWQRARFYEVIAWMPLPEPYKESEVQDADSN